VKLEFVNCRYTRRDELLPVLEHYLPLLPKPLAIISDSIFRLRHIKPMLETKFGEKWKILEYSGFYKEVPSLDEKTILLGTSSIEVGINMVFKSLITEASFWTSTIQRIGRVGRFCEGDVIVLTRKNMEPYMPADNQINRDCLENDILKSALKDMMMSHVCGDMFRGDSYPFLVYDLDLRRLSSYTESIFAMYEPSKWINDWQTLSIHNKKELLKGYGISEEEMTDILIKDKLFSYWGIIEGRLRERYERISVHTDEDELTILCEDSNLRLDFERA